MRNLKIKILMFLATAMYFSCNTTDVDNVISEDDKPLVSYSTTSTMLNEEGAPQIVVNITMDKPIKTSTTFKAIKTGGDAVEHEDFEIGQGVIPAFSTEGQLIITVIEDDSVESTETLDVKVGAFDIPDLYEVIGTDEFTFSIENFESNDLTMTFDWERNILFAGDEYSTCDYVDIDIYIANAVGFDINDPFANAYPDYTAATGACPEQWTLTFENYSDGEYILFTDLYANAFLGINQFDPIPVTATFTRAGVFSGSVEQASSQVFTTDSAPGSSNGFVAKVIISNGVYTILDFSGEIIATG